MFRFNLVVKGLKERIMVFNPFKKRKKEEFSGSFNEEYPAYSNENNIQPLQPIIPPQPQFQMHQDDIQLVLSKIDLLNTKIDNLIQNLNIRLQNIEQRIAKIEKIAEESQKPSKW